MQYQIGNQGRVVMAKFTDGENILEGITTIAKKEEIRAAFFFLLGGMKRGKFVVGPQKEKLPPVPLWRELSKSHEIFGTGTIFWEKDIPKIHFHGTFAKGDDVKAGCLREDAVTFLIIEAIIIEIEGINAERKLDENIGIPLLNLE